MASAQMTFHLSDVLNEA